MSFPKSGKRPKDLRASRRRAMLKAAAADRELVRERQRGLCFAWGVAPGCQQWMHDPHELIPVGAGGPRISSNRVGVCRSCHREAQGRVGGNRLTFEWPCKADGRLPNADLPGFVTAVWRPLR